MAHDLHFYVKECGCFRRNRPQTAYKYQRAHARFILTQISARGEGESGESRRNRGSRFERSLDHDYARADTLGFSDFVKFQQNRETAVHSESPQSSPHPRLDMGWNSSKAFDCGTLWRNHDGVIGEKGERFLEIFGLSGFAPARRSRSDRSFVLRHSLLQYSLAFRIASRCTVSLTSGRSNCDRQDTNQCQNCAKAMHGALQS